MLTLSLLLLLLMLAPIAVRADAARPDDGVALALIYDTSGSMREPVRTADGRRAAKYIVGNRALEQIIHRIEQFATNGASPRRVDAGLFVFSGTGVREAVPFGPFSAPRMTDWLKTYRGPDSGTPLGNALELAGRALMRSSFSRKHILVVTDGINTIGPDPAVVIPRLQKTATDKGTTVLFHFVAFDVDAKVFDPLKKLGVTVMGAADEIQLNQQLEFVLEEKILLEKE